jgi:hypothetical protein
MGADFIALDLTETPMTKQNRLVVIWLSGLVWGVLVVVHVFLSVHNSHNQRLLHLLHGRFVTAFTISYCLGVALGYLLYVIGERAILYLWKIENIVQVKLLTDATPARRRAVFRTAILGLIGFLSWKIGSAAFFGYRYAKWVDHHIVNNPCQPHHAAFSFAWILAGFVVFEVAICYAAVFTYCCVKVSAFVSGKDP